MSASDIATLKEIERKVGQTFRYQLEGDRCATLDLTSEEAPYYGLIRYHSMDDKQEIVSLICRLTGLKQLNLRRNKLFHIPERFAELRGLTHLNLGSNYLRKIPPELQSLKALKYLHLGNNELAEIPEFLGELAPLEYLALHKNMRLKSVDVLHPLKNLRHLNLHYLNLHRLPPFIYLLKKLVTLTVWNVSQFSDELANLTELEFFSDCGCPGLRQLPQALTRLKRLRMMRLFQNSLDELPEDFGNLENLEQLSLYQNQLHQLPDTFARLKKLKKLNLAWNRFRAIPDCLGECSSLEWLAVFENPLKHADSPLLPSSAEVIRVWPFTTLSKNH